MLRDMDFRRVEMLPMLGAPWSAAPSASRSPRIGAGAWAIIAQQIVATVATTLLVWVRSTWRPRFAFSRASLRDLGGFSAYMLGHRML